MNKQEAIRILGETKLCSPLGQACFVGIEALEKQIPKKPVRDREYTLCPNCKKVEIDWLDNYCHGCGQRLDWR